MKLTAGSAKKTAGGKDTNLPTGETSGQPKKTGKSMEYPEGTTHTVKKIKNGYIKQTSYKHPKTGDWTHEEEYMEHDPFTHVEGIKSK